LTVRRSALIITFPDQFAKLLTMFTCRAFQCDAIPDAEGKHAAAAADR
jgi:hypothetical protein